MDIFKGQHIVEFAVRFQSDLGCKKYLSGVKWSSGYTSMKRFKLAQRLTAIIFILGALFSCSDDETMDMDLSTTNDEFIVSKTSAEDIAEGLALVNTKENLTNKSLKKAVVKKQKEIESILEVPDENNKTAYFIINYKEGGFVILAGDKRSEPVLAFSEINQFDINSEYFPTGLVSWLYSWFYHEFNGGLLELRRPCTSDAL